MSDMKSKVSKYLLKYSPVGEQNEEVKDLKTLLGDEFEELDFLPEALKSYSHDHFLIFKDEDGNKVFY